MAKAAEQIADFNFDLGEDDRPEDFIKMDEAHERKYNLKYYRLGDDITGTLTVIPKQKAACTVSIVLVGTELLTYIRE